MTVHRHMDWARRAWLLLLLAIAGCAAVTAAAESMPETDAGGTKRVASFSEGDLSGWEEKSFQQHSEYRLVSAASINTSGSNGELPQGQVLHASTQGQASGLFKELEVDLTRTPYLHWSWQVQNLFAGNAEHSKQGDDYPARIYVVVSGGLFFWKTRAINYVWSSHQPVNSEWPNAYTANARMLAVRAGEKQLGQWLHERRNVREDLQRLFGDDITRIDAVAVMVDGDNTGQSASAYFGDIYFSQQ